MGDDRKQKLADMAYDRMCGNPVFHNMSMDAQGELIVAMVAEVDCMLTATWRKVEIQVS